MKFGRPVQDELEAASGGRAVIANRPQDQTAKLAKQAADKFAEAVKLAHERLLNDPGEEPIRDVYGSGIDIDAFTKSYTPEYAQDVVKTKAGVFYTTGEVDPVAGAKIWMPALSPAAFAALPIKKGGELSEGEPAPGGPRSLDEAGVPFPEFED